ncbi:ATP-dependent DNA helicase RecG [Halanaerobium saccharolyticum]|uniref:ATP-dependent DNA helicase RecG n=1 Tax=Halanaerobium saccharolyticum TaxID=43595 RepID=A0A4R7YPG8_9FIRM|nr:ATP-dependent DNA helicase RecG [Halanaerobium saccharolyticum]RAK04081.1 ATP-dependent DNA helicase RecG [Halanaerobium saccharolyticum]TDV97651.1 ATP-dependent DNA helicase RecG [Halanaerobium saccharolyticum]TDX50920.1 ATP-dependent DNA helicase RecG [Halanaerobium saccharolyticum]
MKLKLSDEVQFVKGVGPKWAERLSKLEIKTVRDLLYYFPREYEDRSQISQIKYTAVGEQANFKVEVLKIDYQKIRYNLDLLRVTFSDGSDVVNGIWYNQSYLRDQFNVGDKYLISGKISEKNWRKYKRKEINNPVYEKLESEASVLNTGRIVPVYSLTEGITQRRLRRVIANALKSYASLLKDQLPDSIRKKEDFPDLKTSILGMHFPKNEKHQKISRRRLAFEEFFYLQLYALEEKKKYNDLVGIQHQFKEKESQDFLAGLGFELTDAQKQVYSEIRKDMESKKTMSRLLQGDVGSGKTVVAALALLQTVANGFQGIFMAPTEILAEQHFLNFKELLNDFDYDIHLLTGSVKASERRQIETEIEAGKTDLIIGTHALFQESLNYNNPGLIVIDEQHRFGVEQRHSLKEKGDSPDLLIMTATPIPRSMAMLIYGDLDLSVIDEMPPGRKKIATFWRRENRRKQIYAFLKEKIEAGRQAYIVCPLIEKSEEMPELISAEELYNDLQSGILKDYKLALIHSSIPADEKKEIMEKFRDGEIDVLVATTVIEVGVDVSNASIMVIENAERFGLAQLHQLRGRVGRGRHQSYCILISNPPGEDASHRLEIMCKSNNGFLIAEEDLKMRGPGEFFGTKQHGIDDLKVASLIDDQKLLVDARDEAQKIVKDENWQQKYNNLAKIISKIELKI